MSPPLTEAKALAAVTRATARLKVVQERERELVAVRNDAIRAAHGVATAANVADAAGLAKVSIFKIWNPTER